MIDDDDDDEQEEEEEVSAEDMFQRLPIYGASFVLFVQCDKRKNLYITPSEGAGSSSAQDRRSPDASAGPGAPDSKQWGATNGVRARRGGRPDTSNGTAIGPPIRPRGGSRGVCPGRQSYGHYTCLPHEE